MTLAEGEVSFELLFIGNELLIGRVLNTNSQWLTRHITLLGGSCSRITVIKDDLSEISKAIKEILDRSPRFLIISGGLGPTFDDMTLEGVSKALNRPLKIDEKALSWISQRYRELYKKGLLKDLAMTPQRVKMARLPQDSKALPNPVGTAPGVLIEAGSTKMVCLPGVPKEVKAIFEESVKEEVTRDFRGHRFLESGFIVEGLGESVMAPIINEVMKRYAPYVYVKSHPKHGGPNVTVEFHLTSKGLDEALLKQNIKEADQYLKDKIRGLGGKITLLKGKSTIDDIHR